LRQRSRPYLFSNSLAPGIVGAALKVLDMLSENTELRDKVMENAEYFRTEMKAKGFDIPDGDAAIVPVMLYDAKLAQNFAEKMMENGVYVIGFFYPVVPKGKRELEFSFAGHSREHLIKPLLLSKK
jgi:glycine C-acetyltransferase